MNKIIKKTQSNNKNVDIDLEKIIENKLNNVGCLLDKLLLSKSADGKPTSDDVINEELSLLCFTVSFFYFLQHYFIFKHTSKFIVVDLFIACGFKF